MRNTQVQVNIIVRRVASLRSVLLTFGQTVEREASLLNLGGPCCAVRSSARTVHIEITAKFLACFHVWNRRIIAYSIVQALDVAGAGGHRINRRAARPTQQQRTEYGDDEDAYQLTGCHTVNPYRYGYQRSLYAMLYCAEAVHLPCSTSFREVTTWRLVPGTRFVGVSGNVPGEKHAPGKQGQNLPP